MSNYTTQIRFICESKSGLTESTGFKGIMNAIDGSVNDIFDFDWPIFDEGYRVPLEVKILRHFYTREISEETFGLWQLRLCDRLNVIMPYYNQLYKSELLKFNPLYDVDLTTEHERANDGIMGRAESTVFNREDLTNRNLDRNATDDGIVDTDSNSKLTSGVVGTNSEETASTNKFKSDEKSDSISSNTTNTNENSGANREDTSQSSESSNVVSSDVNSTTENNSLSTKNRGSADSNGTSDSSGTSKGKNVNRYSDTPQGNVNIGGGVNDGNPSVDSVFGNGYLTNVTIVDDNRQTTDKSVTSNSSYETKEESANQNITKNASNDGTVDQTVAKNITNTGNVSQSLNRNESADGVNEENRSRTENGIASGSKNGVETVDRNDLKTDKINTHNSSVHTGTENEKIVGSGSHTNVVNEKMKNMSTEDFIQRVVGKRGGITYSKMLDEFRKTFLNIDRMILKELDSLFISLWE